MGTSTFFRTDIRPMRLKVWKMKPSSSRLNAGQLVIRGLADILTQKHKTAACRPVQATYDVQERGLAAAGRAHEGYELARLYLQVYALQHGILALSDAIGLLDLIQLDHIWIYLFTPSIHLSGLKEIRTQEQHGQRSYPQNGQVHDRRKGAHAYQAVPQAVHAIGEGIEIGKNLDEGQGIGPEGREPRIGRTMER